MASTSKSDSAPLSGVRVVNIGSGWAGRVAAMLLADQGADVVDFVRPGRAVHPCDPLLDRGKRLLEIDLNDSDNFMASSNYMQVAIEHGWYDPEGNKPFIWQEVYSPLPREWAVSRFWLFYSRFAPNLKKWPNKKLNQAFDGYDAYHQYIEPLSLYPFSVKPEKKVSVQELADATTTNAKQLFGIK